MSSLPFLDEAALVGHLSWAAAIAALERALLAGLDPAGSSPRGVVDVRAGQLLLMPAETGTGVGVKIGMVAPGNPERGLPRIQALYLLLDPVTLTPAALLDGTALTTLRTSAVSGVAVAHLAAPDAAHLVVFGAGPQAGGHVHAVGAVRPVERVTIVGRDAGRAEALVKRLRSEGVEAVSGTAADVARADIVVCATTARGPLFDGDLVPDDACVVAVGSHEPDARELDDRVLARAGRLVVEDPATALREAGEIVQAVASGAVVPAHLIGLGEAVHLDPVPGLSVFKSVGMGWQDLVVAEAAYRAVPRA